MATKHLPPVSEGHSSRERAARRQLTRKAFQEAYNSSVCWEGDLSRSAWEAQGTG